MSDLGRFWAGHAYGTNTGKLFVDFERVVPDVCGKLRFLDSESGVVVYSITGSFEKELKLVGNVEPSSEGEDYGVLDVVAVLTPEGHLRGTWSTSIGTAGTFELFPHDAVAGFRVNPGSVANEASPEQLYTRRVTLGAVRLFAEDVKSLIGFASEEFDSPRPVITYRVRGSEVSKYVSDFLPELSAIGDLGYLKIFIQEPDSHGLNKLVVVELNAGGANEILVQGTRESWVVGRSVALSSFLDLYKSGLVTTYKRFGLNLNSVVFFLVLVFAPEIKLMWDRFVFVLASVLLLGGLYWIHSRFIPNALISLAQPRASAIARALPTIGSWFLAVTASVFAALIFDWVSKGRL